MTDDPGESDDSRRGPHDRAVLKIRRQRETGRIHLSFLLSTEAFFHADRLFHDRPDPAALPRGRGNDR